MSTSDPEPVPGSHGATDRAERDASASGGIVGRAWALLRANWAVIGLLAILIHVPSWLVYGTCGVTHAPWCMPGQDDPEALERWATSVTPSLVTGVMAVVDLLVGAVVSILFVRALAYLWAGRRSRAGSGALRHAWAGLSRTLVRRVFILEVAVLAVYAPVMIVGIVASFGANLLASTPDDSGVSHVFSGISFLPAMLTMVLEPLYLLWLIAWSPIWSTALTMATMTLAVGLWLRARAGRVEPAELWRGGGDDWVAQAEPRAIGPSLRS